MSTPVDDRVPRHARDATRNDQTLNELKGNFNEQLEAGLNADLVKQQADFQAFIKDNNMAFWQEQATSAALFLSGLKNQQAGMLNELQRLENLSPDELLQTPVAQTAVARSAPARGAGRCHPGGSTAPTAAPFNSELYVQYTQVTQQLIQKQSEVEQWKTVWKPKHPKLQALQSQVENLERLIKTIKQQNAAATTGRIASIKADLKSLESSIETWEKKVNEASAKDAGYSDLAKCRDQHRDATG